MAAAQTASQVAGAMAAPPLERVPSDLSPHLRNEDVLTLLREASSNAFRVGFPLRNTASPVPLPDDPGDSVTSQSFYVVNFKDVRLANQAVHRELSVKYKDYSQGESPNGSCFERRDLHNSHRFRPPNGANSAGRYPHTGSIVHAL